MLRESDIETLFIWHVLDMGGKSYKFKSVNYRGVSDRIAMMPDGSTWFVELKAPDGKLKPLQVDFREVCAQYNQKYACLHNVEQINQWRKDYEFSRRDISDEREV
jgi:hypothetical protein